MFTQFLQTPFPGTKFVSFMWAVILLTNPLIASEKIEDLDALDYSRGALQTIREDVRTGIFIIKSGRDPSQLPMLKFRKYRVKKGDTFWTILAKTSQNIDTLMTVNNLSSPGEVEQGTAIYIPNMRGIIHKSEKGEKLWQVSARYKIEEKYIARANNCSDPANQYLFIPCGGVSNLERSLFLGTGFNDPIKRGRLSSGFGLRRNPLKPALQFHKGVDIACPYGSRVHAARSGTVVFAGYNGGYGLLMIVQHAHDYMSYYGHLSKISRKRGDPVNTGDIIALSGNTGSSTGPHLHFEVRKGHQAVHPGVLFK